MKNAVLCFTTLFFMSQVLPVRGNLKEICEHPNGACQSNCIETEVYVGRCLNNRPCCLPMGPQPRGTTIIAPAIVRPLSPSPFI
ncbi:beta-defensin 108B [Meriones unguiculatus]|uniref:beta-defensin 108B n=1 Tax=Meriones unguiculatus TaxID=10047 RepID=UPI00293E64FA|nr:beta-defensin 108B [Meriones unguiculatus]